MKPEPINRGPQKQSCSETISSNCVIWDDDDVPCLGLCKGMRMTDAMYKEAKLTCQLLAQLTGDLTILSAGPPPIDFSGLNFGCAWSSGTSTWTCPVGQVFVPLGSGTPPGYCGILGPSGTGVFVPGVGWVAAAASSVPVLTVTPNLAPKPTTLIGILQLIIDGIPCCDPCLNKGG